MLQTFLENPAGFVVVGIAVISTISAIVILIFKSGGWFTSVNTDRANFKDFMREIREDIKNILNALPPPVVSSSSPLQLTKSGWEVSRKIDATAWARKVAPNWIDKVKGKEPFEIQDYCFENVERELDSHEEHSRKVRQLAYENGLERSRIVKVLAVTLRDEILAILDQSG